MSAPLLHGVRKACGRDLAASPRPPRFLSADLAALCRCFLLACSADIVEMHLALLAFMIWLLTSEISFPASQRLLPDSSGQRGTRFALPRRSSKRDNSISFSSRICKMHLTISHHDKGFNLIISSLAHSGVRLCLYERVRSTYSLAKEKPTFLVPACMHPSLARLSNFSSWASCHERLPVRSGHVSLSHKAGLAFSAVPCVLVRDYCESYMTEAITTSGQNTSNPPKRYG